MSYDVYYKKERNGKFSIIVNNDKVKTPLISESVADALCEDIHNYLDNFNEEEYFFELQLSDEPEPLGIIIDVWQDGEVENEQDLSDEEPVDTTTFLFDDYSGNYYDDDEDDFNDFDESELESYDE